MEDQVPSSTPPQGQPIPGGISPELLEMMKARAREEAIRMTMFPQQAPSPETEDYPTVQSGVPASSQLPFQPSPPSISYVRRNLTVAELIVVFAISCGLVVGVQSTWNFATDILPRIEIRSK